MRAKTVGRKRMDERNLCLGGGVVRSSFIVEGRRIRVQYTATNNMLYFIHIGLLTAPPLYLPCLLGVYAIRPICSCSRRLHIEPFWSLKVSVKMFFHTYLIVYSTLRKIFISTEASTAGPVTAVFPVTK